MKWMISGYQFNASERTVYITDGVVTRSLRLPLVAEPLTKEALFEAITAQCAQLAEIERLYKVVAESKGTFIEVP